MLPKSLKKFIDFFSALPSMGPRQATRLAFYVIKRGKGFVAELSAAARDLGNIKNCSQCFFPFEDSGAKSGDSSLCLVCRDARRNQKVIAIVEKETDFISLEKTRKFPGRYLVLGEISKDGVLTREQRLRLNHLKSAIQKKFGQAEEIVLAFNPTTLGDLESGLLLEELKPLAAKITRLGRGLPTGGEIEFADEDTLGGALENRR